MYAVTPLNPCHLCQLSPDQACIRKHSISKRSKHTTRFSSQHGRKCHAHTCFSIQTIPPTVQNRTPLPPVLMQFGTHVATTATKIFCFDTGLQARCRAAPHFQNNQNSWVTSNPRFISQAHQPAIFRSQQINKMEHLWFPVMQLFSTIMDEFIECFATMIYWQVSQHM